MYVLYVTASTSISALLLIFFLFVWRFYRCLSRYGYHEVFGRVIWHHCHFRVEQKQRTSYEQAEYINWVGYGMVG